MYHLPAERNFLGIEDNSYCDYTRSRFVIFEAPYEHSSSYRAGSQQGPSAIIRASRYVEYYDEQLEQESFRRGGICTVEPLNFSGKVDRFAVALVERQLDTLLKDGKFPIMLGAEHTVTLGAVRALCKRFPKLSVLQLDAHADLRESYQGSSYSHASVMARVLELNVSLVQVGIRALSIEEAERIRGGATALTVFAHQLRSRPVDEWIGQVVSHLGDDVYITIDADGFDPSIVPAVGTAEPNGLRWSESLELLAAVCAQRNVVGFDVVEMAPDPHSTLSEYTLAKLVYRLIGMITLRGG
jgi:agmatinase